MSPELSELSILAASTSATLATLDSHREIIKQLGPATVIVIKGMDADFRPFLCSALAEVC